MGIQNDQASTLDAQLRQRLNINSDFSAPETTDRELAESMRGSALMQLGKGACGKVYAEKGSSTVVKVAKSGDSTGLWNDFLNNRRIAQNLTTSGVTDVEVPTSYRVVSKEATDIEDGDSALTNPDGTQTGSLEKHALYSERVLPLPRPTQVLLIERFCLDETKVAALRDADNENCLVRVYLGSVRGRAPMRIFSLRKFKLHLNQMQDLQMDTDALAASIARCLAVLHWVDKTDASGVEFVLGSSKHPVPSPAAGELTPMVANSPGNVAHRKTALWLLDFDRVRAITMDSAGVKMAIKAHVDNAPYYPKPVKGEKWQEELWDTFVEHYLTKAYEVLPIAKHFLPRLFIRGLIQFQLQRERNGYEQDPFIS